MWRAPDTFCSHISVSIFFPHTQPTSELNSGQPSNASYCFLYELDARPGTDLPRVKAHALAENLEVRSGTRARILASFDDDMVIIRLYAPSVVLEAEHEPRTTRSSSSRLV